MASQGSNHIVQQAILTHIVWLRVLRLYSTYNNAWVTVLDAEKLLPVADGLAILFSQPAFYNRYH